MHPLSLFFSNKERSNTPMTEKKRCDSIIARLSQMMPNAKSELNYTNEYELLIAVMLSAQCTDARVNMVTPSLFAHYPTPQSLAEASENEVLGLIASISYPNSKAKHIIETARRITSSFGGRVPQTIEELTSLPGVGRKTANVMLAVAFGKPAMPVDTHVFRVAKRTGLAPDSKSPEETEKILTQKIPQSILSDAHHYLLLHGRYVCTAKNPKCEECGIREWCKEYEEKR